MPGSRRRTRPRSHSYDRDREPKRRKIGSFESPQHKRSLSSDKTHRSRQYDLGSSCERRYKRSKRRSPTSKKRHRHRHEKSLSRRKHSPRSYSTDQSTHISALPTEILLYILRWVVSSDLDMRSLEMCSRTCRAFYLCCRDSEIWRLACARAWGLNLGRVPNGFNLYRQMFIERPRLQFNGCYISKDVDDNIYWYLRFFPEGLVLTLTATDEQCVEHLKYRTSKSPAMSSGRYILKDDKVTLVVPLKYPNWTIRRKLQIQSYKNQRHSHLVLIGYSGYSADPDDNSGTENTRTCDLEIRNRRLPFWFFPVKSYTAESYSPLQ